MTPGSRRFGARFASARGAGSVRAPERRSRVRLAAAAGLSVVWQPAGKPLEDWAFVLLRYSASPRVAVWRPGVPMPGSPGPERSTVTIGGPR